jgi:predicted HD phosphohydrolase
MNPFFNRNFPDADVFVNALFGLMEACGGVTYFDSGLTQLEHALQCACLAQETEAPDSLVAAALLHDVGHILVDEHNGLARFLGTDLHHEAVGSRLLGRWFGPEVVNPVALHVRAKRYLVRVEPEYAAMLSPATQRSLIVQGGPLSSLEAEAFIAGAYAPAAIELRRWDDQAKVRGQAVPCLREFAPLLLAQARAQKALPQPSITTALR